MALGDAPETSPRGLKGATPGLEECQGERLALLALWCQIDVSKDIPLVQGHKFVKFDDRILIVQPSSRLVVAMIPRYKLVE
jgi:hypothetical protein